MALDPADTVQQHANEPMSVVLGATAKLAPVLTGLDMIGANTDSMHYAWHGDPGTLDRVTAVLDGTLSADATITITIDGAPVEPDSGVITVPAAGSALGAVKTYVPTSANTVLAAGSIIHLLVGGANATATFADVTLHFSYAPEATP